ncbi:MAG: aldehyde dehydrogenase family protein, partial [Pseudomonadota bacterium]|nr:aldehyde dehydrogenase family protein [Pseudomonadota bacterium]
MTHSSHPAFQPAASHFINGAYVEDTAGEKIDVIYPHTGEVIATLHAATPAIVDAALAAAKDAQVAWAQLSGTERGRVLRRAADLMRERNHDLSVIETHDTGKPMSETLVADAASGADALEYFGGLAGTLTGEHIPVAGGDFVYTRREPLGVCVGIGAWNYPIQIASWKAAPALASGCSIVIKPASETPLSALAMAELAERAGVPSGVLSVVVGASSEIGPALTDSPLIRKLTFT